MKIALIVTGGLHPSGREQVIPALVTLLARLSESHEVHAFVLRHLSEPQTYFLQGARVHDLGRPRGRLQQWRTLARALRTHGPFDVVHGYWAEPAGLSAVLAGKQMRRPAVVTCDSGEFVSLPDVDYGLQRVRRRRWAVRYACRRAAVVHVTSGYMRSLAADHGIDAVRVPLGIDTATFATTERASDGPPWRLLQVASLNRVKDHSTLLAALARIRESHDVRLDLVGEDTLAGQLQNEARQLGVNTLVSFHGFVPHDRLRAFHGAAHLYVQSSLHEAGGVAVLEAAAAGLPIVGTRVGHLSDWAADAAVGVPAGDAGALANAIVELLDAPVRRKQLSAAAQQRVRDYDARVTAPQLLGLYAAAVERFAKRSPTA